MQLLSGADISIRFDKDRDLYVVVVMVGFHSTEFVDKDPVQALGVSLLLQAGFTPKKLHYELTSHNKQE
jgi:hypothetical protein